MLYSPDRGRTELGYSGIRIAVIYGFLAREFVGRHLLRFLRDTGYPDTTLYGHLFPVARIADDLEQAAREGRPIALVGFSQGGFQAVKVARALHKRGIEVKLVVTIGSGGMGRLLPRQWGFNPRQVPPNIMTCLNYFSEGDALGADKRFDKNLLMPGSPEQTIENYGFPKGSQVSHFDLITCYPADRVHPEVRSRLLERLVEAL